MQEGGPQPVSVLAPQHVWRVGRAPDPLAVRPPDYGSLRDTRSGNRFDSMSGTFDVVYFATDLRGCFAETLRRFQPKPEIAEIAEAEWADAGHMAPGNLAADWRLKRLAAQVSLPESGQFLHVEAAETMEHLWAQLHSVFVAWGYTELDVSVIRGGDRRVTRTIAEWAATQLEDSGAFRYDGIRYVSRLGSDWECWAVFGDVDYEVADLVPITLDMPDLQHIARLYGLTLH